MMSAARWTTIAAAGLLLAACGGGGQSSVGQPSGTTKSFVNERYGISISYPADFQATPGFSQSYLQNGAWKTYAEPNGKGEPIVALVLTGSNEITDAELRIGASRDPKAVQDCTRSPDAVQPGSVGRVTLDGVNFSTFKAGDAAMSHYLLVHSYRAVHNGACYAIDLLIYGTNPQVYDPPRKPPFTHEQAFARLHAALRGFRFIDEL